jgi:hypothetical protein
MAPVHRQHRPRGTAGGGLDRQPRPHPRGGAHTGRFLPRARRRLRQHLAAIALRRNIYVRGSSAEAQAVLQQALDQAIAAFRKKL